MFTSGTAGSPRAAMLSHGNLLSNIEQVRSADASTGPDDVVYGVLPLFHIFGLNVVLGISLARGRDRRARPALRPVHGAGDDPRAQGHASCPVRRRCGSRSATSTTRPPTASPRSGRATTGAAKMPEEAMRRLEIAFGLELAEGYGLTEASPVVTSSARLQIERRLGRQGARRHRGAARRRDRATTCSIGDAGEIWVKGPNVFQGYLDDPEQTARVLTPDGWLRTGDIAIADDDGYLYLVDRAKDLIIVSGFNVYPARGRGGLAEHPGVAEVGVIGVPHPHTGEAVKAFVVPSRGRPRRGCS